MKRNEPTSTENRYRAAGGTEPPALPPPPVPKPPAPRPKIRVRVEGAKGYTTKPRPTALTLTDEEQMIIEGFRISRQPGYDPQAMP